MTAVVVDSNVILDLFTVDSRWYAWSSDAIAVAGDSARLVINPIVYAEVSVGFERIEDLEDALPADLYRREALPDEAAFLGQAMVPDFDGHPTLEEVDERRQRVTRFGRFVCGQERGDPAPRAPGEGKEAAGVPGEGVEGNAGGSPRVVEPAAGDEGGEVAVPFARFREQYDVRGMPIHLEGQLGAEDPIEPDLTRGLRKTHGAPEVVMIGEGEGGHAQRLRARHEGLGFRGPIAKREDGVAVEFGVHRGQSYQPCTNHDVPPSVPVRCS